MKHVAKDRDLSGCTLGTFYLFLEVGYLCSNDHTCLLTLGSHVNIANLLEPALKDANITTEAHHLDAVNAVCSP